MKWYKGTLEFKTQRKGLYPITGQVSQLIHQWGVLEGMCVLFIPHTSASLVLNESYDPTARIDLESFMDRLAPENQSWYRHTLEGSDDSPSHIRAMVTQPDVTIPIDGGDLSLGTWQGIYLFEHRAVPHLRKILVRALAVD